MRACLNVEYPCVHQDKRCSSMSTFSEEALLKKIAELNTTQHSIQTLSLWLIHHRKHRATVVAVWFRELLRAENNRKLVFMYLANDVIQTSKKKGPEYCQEFDKVLEEAFESLTLDEYDEKTRRNILRIIKIWEDRDVFSPQRIIAFKRALIQDSITGQRNARLSIEGAKENLGPETEEDVKLNVPTVGELSGLLQDLKNSASMDVATQSRIDALTNEVSPYANSDMFLGYGEEAKEVDQKIDNLVPMIAEYNIRLSDEMATRKKMVSALESLMSLQHESLQKTRKEIEEINLKLKDIQTVKQGLRYRMKTLPHTHRHSRSTYKSSYHPKRSAYRPY